MAIMKCSECGKEISTAAEVCPHCGYRTVRGQTASEAKAVAILWVFAAVTMLIGMILVLSNMVEFFDRADHLDRYRYFSDEGKSAVIWFFVGTVVLIVGLCQAIGAIVKTRQLSYMSYYTASSGSASNVSTSYPGQEFIRPRPNTTGEKIPTWKKIELEEQAKKRAQAEQTQISENRTNGRKCIFCGAEMSEKQVFCGFCGRRKD